MIWKRATFFAVLLGGYTASAQDRATPTTIQNAKPSAAAAEQKEIKRTNGESIGLRIVGTIADANHSSNVALVKELESGRVKAVKPGHFVLDKKYKVLEVRPKYVMLESKDSYELVYQNKFAGDFMPSKVARKNNLEMYKEDGFERRDSEIRMTAMYRNKLVQEDLSQVLMQATAIPHSENGKVIGFKLLQIDRDSIYDKAGFKDHDVIVSINDNDLTSVSGAINLLQSLRKESAIAIEYVRNGERKSVTINVN